ncbi:MAG TPA: hypothetical protein VIJ27_12540 [Mucilaginibacter sp.]
MNKLVKPIFCILFVLAFSYKSFGQRHVRMPVERFDRRMPNQRTIKRQPTPRRKMEFVKEGYIGIRLKLTPDESNAFWPVYRHYIEEQTAVRILKRENNSTNSPDGSQQIDNELKYETDLVNIRKHYNQEFLKILPPEKVSELYKSEREFNDEVLKQLSERSIRAGD